MKIKEVIKAFEDIAPLYEKAIKEKWDYGKCCNHFLESGICYAIKTNLNVDVYSIFRNYYKKFVNHGFLFRPLFTNNQNSLHQRLKFLKTEIKNLKRLQKLGYTDI